MNNLERFLSEIAWGLDEQAGALTDDGAAAIAPTAGALRDWASQMRAVADATLPDGAVAWTGVDGEVGVDLEPEPEPLIRIVFGAREVNELTYDVDVEPRTAISRAVAWAPAIERSARELCSSQLRSVMEIDTP
ncbi:MAG: hypothetical protein JST59_30200 [Actinobacteria bacterium]|nr:hypothetical protein [Actinomycetota bacterium]